MAPRRGNENIAQGIALGPVRRSPRPVGATALHGSILLPLQGEGTTAIIPRAMPWAECYLALQADCRLPADVHYI